MLFWKVVWASICSGNRRTELTQWLVRDAPQTLSGFTDDNWEIYMDARMVQLYNSLRCEVFLNLLQLRFFTAVSCHNRLFVELMGQVTVFIKEQWASSCKDKRSGTRETSDSRKWLLISIFGWIVWTTWARKRPKSFGFGAATSHLQLQHIIFSGPEAASGATVLLYKMKCAFRVWHLNCAAVCS